MQQQIVIQCTPDDLRGIIAEEVARAILPMIDLATRPSHSPKLLTRLETARFLGISLPTLHEWTKTGKIIANRISTRVRYYESDVEASLIQMNSKEAKRA